ncbi:MULTISPECIES: class I SAM-dependent methyltransferase [unclassified Cryobacterium]|uniref:class I SAM-dependent methyltransferase n=1 Tax=unclassified Cryobacterium TaxID=2649013 RepID=UPI0018CBD054|nr:class I SAM-dependent methyltransferase [Cryobacterium sp. CAN_C3]
MTININVVRGETAEEEKLNIHAVYEKLASEYDDRIPGSGPSDDNFTAAERDFLLSKVTPGQDVLDIGCGTGRFTVPMAELGAIVSGLDMSGSMLRVAASKLKAKGLSADLREGDMVSMPFDDDSFDIVTSMLALMHIPLEDRQQVFQEASRVLRPGGRLLISVKNSVIERFFRADRFAAVDITDVDTKKLKFTETNDGQDLEASWYSFSPSDISALCAASGLVVTQLRGNSPVSAWLADEILADPVVSAFVGRFESALSDVPPFNHLGYHIMVEAVKLP